jgi:hypothetical protein
VNNRLSLLKFQRAASAAALPSLRDQDRAAQPGKERSASVDEVLQHFLGSRAVHWCNRTSTNVESSKIESLLLGSSERRHSRRYCRGLSGAAHVSTEKRAISLPWTAGFRANRGEVER